jgi:hypothetical protein
VDQLRELFHPDGTIEISWFEGLASDFVDGSLRMGEYARLDLGCSTHARFYDQAEKRNGAWKIVKRVFATKGSHLEKTMKANGRAWLAA